MVGVKYRSALLVLIERIDSLHRAHRTSRTKVPWEVSPYQPLVLLAIAISKLENHPKFRNGNIDLDLLADRFGRLYAALYDPNNDLIDQGYVQAIWSLSLGEDPGFRLLAPDGFEGLLLQRKSRTNLVKTESEFSKYVRVVTYANDLWSTLDDPLAAECIVSFILARYFADDFAPSRLKDVICLC